MEMTNEKFETEMTNEKTDSPVYFCVDVVDGAAYYCRFWEDCVLRPIYTYDDIYCVYSPISTWDELFYAEGILEYFSKMDKYSEDEDFGEVREEKIISLENVIGWRSAWSADATRLLSEIRNGNVSKEIIDELAYIVYESVYAKMMKRRESGFKFNCPFKEQRFNPADAMEHCGYTELASILEMIEEFGFCFGYDADAIEHDILRRTDDNEGALRLVKAIREGIEDKAEAKRVADELWRFFYGDWGIPRPKEVRQYKYQYLT